MGGNSIATTIGTISHGNFGEWGFITDGAARTDIGSESFTNRVAGWQIGNSANGARSYLKMIASHALQDLAGLAVDDSWNMIKLQHSIFDSYGVGINVTANPTTHYIRDSLSVNGLTANVNRFNDSIFGGGGSDAANYVNTIFSYGTKAVVLANSFRTPFNSVATAFGDPHIIVSTAAGSTTLTANSGVAIGAGSVKFPTTNATPTSILFTGWWVVTNATTGQTRAIPTAIWP